MNKVTKGFIIAAVCCIVIGLCVTLGTAAAGGIGAARGVLNQEGISFFSWDPDWNSIEINLDEDDFEDIFDNSHEVYRQDASLTFPLKEANSMSIVLGAGKVELGTTNQKEIQIRTENVRRFQAYTEDDTLYIKGVNRNVGHDGTIYIDIPKDKKWEDVSLSAGASQMIVSDLTTESLDTEIGAGDITFENLSAVSGSIKVGAGKTSVKEGTFQDADIEVGMGDFSMSGEITGDLDAKCSMGNLSLQLGGREEDHNYSIECALGNISFNGSNLSGVAADRTIDNDAASDYDLECAMGNIQVSFEQ